MHTYTVRLECENDVIVEGFISKIGSGSGWSTSERQFLYLNKRPVDVPVYFPHPTYIQTYSIICVCVCIFYISLIQPTYTHAVSYICVCVHVLYLHKRPLVILYYIHNRRHARVSDILCTGLLTFYFDQKLSKVINEVFRSYNTGTAYPVLVLNIQVRHSFVHVSARVQCVRMYVCV